MSDVSSTGSKTASAGTAARVLPFVHVVRSWMRIGLISALALIAAASGLPTTTRANQVEAESQSEVCTLLADDERADAVRAAEDKWGVPAPLMLAFMRQESHFRAEARHPRSSAYGYAQAVRSTWRVYRDETGNLDAKRNNFADSMDFIGWYASGIHQHAGVPYSNTIAHYLAYSRGPAAKGPADAAAKRNAARVAAYAKTYDADLKTCPIEPRSSGLLALFAPAD